MVANYAGAIVLALRMPHAFRVPLMVGAHALLAGSVIVQTKKLEAEQHSQKAIAAFYRFIWNLFYTEYCLLPFL